MKNWRYIIFLIVLFTSVTLLVYFFVYKNPTKQKPNTINISKQEIKEEVKKSNPDILTYTHPELGFSFKYSDLYSLGIQVDNESNETLLIQSKNKGSVGQIYISSFPVNVTLTAELLQKEFPSKKFINGKKVLIGGVEAFSFESLDEQGLETWEVVYANNGYIYQAMSTKLMQTEFETILTTWEF